jgi:hypothetical protein
MKIRIIESVSSGYAFVKMIKPTEIKTVGNFYCFNKSVVHRQPLPTIPFNRSTLQSRYNSENLGIVFID